MWRGRHRDTGMSTAEYAVGTFAAVAFAMVLWRVVNSAAVYSSLTGIIDRALSALVITGTAAW
jgi:Protein of unknown function (DUF4244)